MQFVAAIPAKLAYRGSTPHFIRASRAHENPFYASHDMTTSGQPDPSTPPGYGAPVAGGGAARSAAPPGGAAPLPGGGSRSVFGRRGAAAPAQAAAGGAAVAANNPIAGQKYVDLLKEASDPLRIALLVLMLFTIGRMHQHYSFLMPLRPALVSVLFSAVYAIMYPQSLSKLKPLMTWQGKSVLAIGALAVIGAPFGLSFGQSMKFFIDLFSKVLGFWILLVLATRNVTDLSWFVWSYVFGAAFNCYLSIFVIGSTMQGGSLTNRLDDSAMYMFDPNDICVILAVALPLALLSLETSRWKGKIFGLLTVIGIAITIALSGSRGGLIGLVVVSLALLFMLKRVPVIKRMAIVVAAGVALTLSAPDGYWEQMKTMLNPEEDYNLTSEDGRKQIWLRGLGYMRDYPVFGLGYSNFGRAEGTISTKAKNRDPYEGIRFIAPHNSFIEIGAELGLPGLYLFCSLCFGGIWSLLRLRKRLPASWADGDFEQRYLYGATMYVPVSLIGFITTGFFVSFAYQDIIYIITAFGIGTHVIARRRLAEETGGQLLLATAPAVARRGAGAPRGGAVSAPPPAAAAPQPPMPPLAQPQPPAPSPQHPYPYGRPPVGGAWPRQAAPGGGSRRRR